MDRNFNKARNQGILGAVCILCASASFLASDQSVFWIVRTLAWLFALTFFHYALIRAQELSSTNVFTIFKYAYNGFLAVILCTVALYVFDKNYLRLISRVIIPLAVFAVSIAWVVINLKLAKASGCALFSVYAWMLVASMGANFIYGMLEVLSPALIASIVKFAPLANALFDLATSGVLLAAWINAENFSNEQDEIEVNLTNQLGDRSNLNAQSASEPNFSAQHERATELKFDADQSQANKIPPQKENVQENSYERETLKAAKRQGIISCQLMLATVAVSFFAKLYLIFTRPHGESQEQLIKLLEGSVNFVLFLAAAVYMWHALKKLEEIYDADVLSIYKQMIFASIVFAVVGIAFGFIRGIEDRPAAAGTGLAGLFTLAITVYLAVLWVKLNFSLAKITENDLFKTYVFFAIASFIIAFALQIIFTAVFSILLATLAIAALYVLPTAFYLYAWTMIKEE
ncbi:hypothetical protein [uncultured Campylobacter sp.]|uniref:hypothetical protein n=1 Tax=uncultured Campylobacter sp. TaxID=218934 RepID=UPI0026068545|nr:hypothetical protein [uncultured Campylobacter sp.]